MPRLPPLETPRQFPDDWEWHDERLGPRDKSVAKLLMDEGLATPKEIAEWWVIAWQYGLREPDWPKKEEDTTS